MISYREGAQAMDWLAAAFGFRERTRWLDDDGVLTHGEMTTRLTTWARCSTAHTAPKPQPGRRSPGWSTELWSTWMTSSRTSSGPRLPGPTLLSTVEEGPEDTRLYRAEDIEGHRWMFVER